MVLNLFTGTGHLVAAFDTMLKSSCSWLAAAVLFTVGWQSAFAVDAGKFRKCDEGFCKRHRNLKASDTPQFYVVAASVRLEGARVIALLNRTGDGRQFKFTLQALVDSRLRMTLDELNPIRKRYFPEDALDGPYETDKLFITNQGPEYGEILSAQGNRVRMTYKPFRLDVYRGKEELLLSLNSRGLLKFEHYRLKPGATGGWFGGGGGGGSASLWWWQRLYNWVRGRNTVKSSKSWSSLDDDDEISQDMIDDFKAQPVEVDENEDVPDENAVFDEAGNRLDLPQDQADDDLVAPEDKPQAAEDEDHMWEEHWKTHHDRKPHGPSSIGLDVSFVGFEHLFGLPEHADSFALKSTALVQNNTCFNREPYRLYNLDVFEYDLNSPMALYGSIPYVLAHNPKGTVGLLWLNAAETWVDVRSSVADKGLVASVVDKLGSGSVPHMDAHFISESGFVDVFIFLGPKPTDVFRQYSKLTGVCPLPPLFAIAYHQCRWNYNDMDDVAAVDAGFDKHDIPYDTLWLDIEHTDGKKYFTWDAHKFADPKAMIDGLAAKQRKMVTIIDPHIKKDDSYPVWKDAHNLGFFVKDRDDREYEGHCWPGASMYLDFMNPAVRDYWVDQFALDRYVGSTPDLYTWNDMNEPSVFSGPEITMHKDAKHFGDLEHRDVHNLYGFYHHMATFNGLLKRSEGKKRPFVLTRAFFVGSQRYSAVWTGDNAAQWGHLQASIPMLLSLSVSGIPFVGADVGGFFGNPDEQLLVRWYQAGAFQPFFRAHAHLDSRRREPWLFSKQTTALIRDAIRRRYAILPYLYTKYYQHEQTGVPVMRPLWQEFPEDTSGYDEEKQFFLGEALLVRPVIEENVQQTSIYLPGKETIWYNWDTRKGQPGPGALYVDTPLDKIPVFQRGGTIVPTRERPRRASAVMANDPLTLRVALNMQGDSATGELYMDEGDGYEYKQGAFLHRRFVWKGEDRQMASLTNVQADESGKFKSSVTVERIIVLGLQFYPSDVHLFNNDYHAEALEFEFERESMSMVIRKPDVLVAGEWRIDIHG